VARKLFFSFHYERDAWRAGQVRNCNLLPSEDEVGFIDAADWESIKKQGDQAIRRWIAGQLKGTSVTVVLIGSETSEREWVQHEILESWNRGNGLVGVWVHNVKDSDKKTGAKGSNPFDSFKLPDGTTLSSVCKTYDWVLDDGRNNLGDWADEAAEIRAEFTAEDEISLNSTSGELGTAVVAAGAVALGALVAAVFTNKPKVQPPSPVPSASFRPRAPWAATNDLD
jgi:hypothetical protein